MKRILLLMLAMVCALSFAACGNPEAEEMPTESITEKALAVQDDVKVKFAEQWNMYLDAWDELLFVQKNLYTKIEKFCNEKTWEAQTDAAMTAVMAEKHINSEINVELIMTNEDYDYLLEKGLDLSMAPAILEQVTGEATEDAYICKSLYDRLCEAVYTEDEFNLLCEMVETKFKEIDAMAAYVVAEANCVATDLNTAETTQLITDFIENSDILSKNMTSWSDSSEQAIAAMNTAMDQLEVVITAKDGFVGAEEGIKSSYEDVKKNPVEVEGMPLMLPDPIWFNPNDAEVYPAIYDGTDVTMVDSFDEELISQADGCVMKVSGVSRDDVKMYIEAIKEKGYSIVEEKDENGVVSAKVDLDGYMAVIELSADEVTITITGETICFAPVWYLER